MNKEIIGYQSLLEFENAFHKVERKILIYIYHKYIKKIILTLILILIQVLKIKLLVRRNL